MSELARYEYAIQRLIPDLLFGGYMKMVESGSTPVAGDIVMLHAAPQSVWHLSIFREKLGPDEFLLESLKTGKECRWSNVGIMVLSRKWVAEWPRILWTDEQFRFARIFDAECRRADYYMHLPYLEDFTPESAVIATRTRFSSDELRTQSDPFDWREMSRADLRTRIATQVCAHRALSQEARKASVGAQS
jgi:hypothetical protein